MHHLTRAPGQGPDGTGPLDALLLVSGLAADGHDAVAQTEGDVLAVRRPRARVHPSLHPGGNIMIKILGISIFSIFSVNFIFIL
jgi:hypothetical protein